MRGARKEKLNEAADEVGESQGAGGDRAGQRREEAEKKKRKNRRLEEGWWSETREDLPSRSGGPKPRQKTPVEVLFHPHRSWP